MTTQEKNWELMTVFHMPWSEASSLSEEDRGFLLEKSSVIREQMEKQQEMYEKEMERTGQSEGGLPHPPMAPDSSPQFQQY
jgi:hypothetical protein